MLYKMLFYVTLYNTLCCVMFILRYRTCTVYVMLYNMLYLCYITCYVTLYNMLCCVISHVILCCYVCYITRYVR